MQQIVRFVVALWALGLFFLLYTLELYWFSFLIVMGVYGCCGYWLVKQFSAASYEVVFFVFSSVYVLAGLIDYVVFSNSSGFSPDYIAFITFQGSLFLLVYVSIISAFGQDGFVYERDSSDIKSSTIDFHRSIEALSKAFLFVLMAAYLFMTLKMIADGIIGGSRSELYSQKHTSADVLKRLIPIFIMFALIANKKGGSGKGVFGKTGIVSIALFFSVVEMALYGDRRLSLTLILALLIIFYNGQKVGYFKPLLIIGLSFLMIILGYIRNRPLVEIVAILADFEYSKILNPVNTEFGYFHKIGAHLYELGFYEIQNFTAVNIIPSLIPKFMYEGRPLAPPIWYVKTYFPDVYDEGGGFAYNILIESYQNISFLGPLYLGVVVSLMNLLIYKADKITRPYFYTLLFFSGFFMMRLDSVSFVRSVLFPLVVLCMLFLMAKLLKGFRLSWVSDSRRKEAG